MAMTRRGRRLAMVSGGLAALALAVALLLLALSENIVFFFSPTDALARNLPQGENVRLGGLVEPGSVRKAAGNRTVFAITDGANSVTVTANEPLPDLFAEGKGVVVEGAFAGDRSFHAHKVLAKHDENYMPPEVAEALKKQGHWQGNDETRAAP